MPSQSLLRGWDLAVIAGYLALLAAAGIYFSTRRVTAEGYFVGNRAFPGWAVGLSMFATSISSMTFLGFPAAAFILDWRQVVHNLMLPVVLPLALLFFIPFFRRGRLTSAFEYLEQRFGPGMRLAGAVVFLLMQFVRLAMVLYLVSLPLQILTGASSTWIILILGLIVTFYTAMGGFAAVTWIDVIQATVLITGGLAALACIVIPLPGGLSKVFEIGIAHHKFDLGGWRWDPAARALPVMILVGLVNWMGEYTTNQNVVQRYLAASSTREARKATTICCLMSVPIWVFFYFVGTSLFVFYQVYPDATVTQMAASGQGDRVFPYFIVTQIPAGLAGLVIAGLLAATMSLDSNINAVATISVFDILKRHLLPGRSDQFYLRAGQVMSLVAAAVMIAGGTLLASVRKESMVHLSFILTAVLFGGGLAGVFLIGFLTTRVNYGCALVALVLSVAFDIYLVLGCSGYLPTALTLPVHPYLIGFLANLFFMAAAYALSLLMPVIRSLLSEPAGATNMWTRPSRESLHLLTVWTMSDEPPGDGGFPVLEARQPATASLGRTL
jgi:SSS family solute:Na+ symporter